MPFRNGLLNKTSAGKQVFKCGQRMYDNGTVGGATYIYFLR
jgi:hypothetical protein